MFDFSKSKVRLDGKVLDKFTLCQVIHRVSMSLGYGYFKYLVYSLYPETFSYQDCKNVLKFLVYEQDSKVVEK